MMVNESVGYLVTDRDGVYLDATVGDGGHAIAILEKLGARGKVIGVDIDEDALQTASQRLSLFGKRVRLIRGDYAELERLVREEAGVDFVAGVLFDLGLRAKLVEDPMRGFSFKRDGPLDMRYDMTAPKSAFDVVNTYSVDELAEILRRYGDVRGYRRIARAIVAARQEAPIRTTEELCRAVESKIPARFRSDILPRIFQAIRIEVNDELRKLRQALEQALEVTAPGGRIVVIAYHSGEDRIVKEFFATEAKDCICPPGIPVCRCGHRRRLKILTPKPIRPTKSEVERNPRARAARMRVAEKIDYEKGGM